MAGLHARAGARALASAAIDAARRAFEGGLALLPEGERARDAEIGRKLLVGACHTATQMGDHAAAEAHLAALRARIELPAQAFEVYGLDMALSHHKGNLGGVVDTGLTALEALGAGIERFPTQEHLAALQQELAAVATPEAVGALGRTPFTDDPREHAIHKFLFAVGPCAYLTQQGALWQQVCSILALRSLQGRKTPMTAYGLSGTAMWLAGALGQYERARMLGEGAIAVAEAASAQRLQGVARFMVGGFVVHWTQPLPEAVAMVDRGYRDALSVGDAIYAGWNLASGAISATLAGRSLEDAIARAERMAAYNERVGLADNVLFLGPLRQFARALRGETDGPTTLEGEGFSEDAFLETAAPRHFRVPVHVHYVLRALLQMLEGEVDAALASLEAARPVMGTSFAMPILVLHRALDGLVAAMAAKDASGPRWDALGEARDAFARYATAGEHHRPWMLLLEAEQARLRGDAGEAMDRYERAMDAAIACGNHLHTAIAGPSARPGPGPPTPPMPGCASARPDGWRASTWRRPPRSRPRTTPTPSPPPPWTRGTAWTSRPR